MALKNLFDMVKADRYTADGREAIIKAQEAETEDATRRTYQIGEISQATGLQKTANGWVKPKSGKQPGAASKHDTDPQTYIVKKNDELRKMYLNEKDPAKKEAMKKALKKQASMMEPEPFSSTESKPAAQEEIGKFYTKFKDVQEAYDAGRDTYPEGGYKIYNTPQGYKVIGNEAAKIQQRMEEAGYEVETEVPEGTKPPRYPGDTPAKRQSATRQRGEQLAQPADKRQDEGYQHWLGVLPGYKDGSLLEQRKKLQESVDEFEEDMQDYDRRGLASAAYGKRIDQKNWQIGALKAIDEEMERRGMDPAPRTSVPDSAPSLSEIVDRVYNIGEISEKTGLQKTANGWRPVKKGTAPAKKQEKKGAGIPQATTETFVGKTYKDFVESATPSGYKPTKNTDNPDGSSTTVFEKEGKQLKVDFDKSGKITKVTPGENKPAAAPKLNQVEKVDGVNRPYRIKGTQFYFDTPEEAESAIVTGRRGDGKTWAKPSSDGTINEIQNALGFRLDTLGSGKSMDKFMKKTGDNEYAANVWSFGTDSKGTLINPLDETDSPNAVIKKENGEWKLHYKDREGKETIVTATGRQDPTRDSAPRVLTGDCRIRIRKEKPALTGDTKIRVRK